jgi:lipopolysaccharide exporter
MTGTAIAQFIGFVFTPIISRLYSPADFGVYGSFGVVLSVIIAMVTLQYSQAIMLPKDKEDAINLFFVSCLSTVFVGLLCLIVCLTAPAFLNGLMKTEGVWALALLVIGTVIAGINNSCQAWSVRVKAFKHTSVSQVIRSISTNGAKIGFGYIDGGAAGLMCSTVLADVSASFNLIRILVPDILALKSCVQWNRIRRLAKEYIDFPVYSATQNVLNSLSSGMPVLLLTHFYGISIAGAYAFGVSILNVPMGFALSAIRQVLFQKAGETQNRGGSLARLYVKTTAGLFAMAIVPSLILLIWAPQLFSLIFGSQWYMAGELARSLVIWLSVVFCNLPAVLFARIIRIQRFVFFYDLTLLCARALTLILGGMYLNVSQCVMLFALVGAAMNAFLILKVGYVVMKKEGQINSKRIRDILMKE